MATAMVTLIWCDRHLAEKDEEVPAQPMPVMGSMQLDLCEECAAPLQEALALYERFGSSGARTLKPATVRKRAAAAGVKGAAPAPEPGKLQCPKCDTQLTGRASLGAHARQTHGMTIGELEGKPITHTCEECGAGFTSFQGHALHLRKHERERQRSAAAAQPARKSA